MSALRKFFRKKKKKDNAQLLESSASSPPPRAAPPTSASGPINEREETLLPTTQSTPSVAPNSVIPPPSKMIHSYGWCSSCANIPQEIFSTTSDLAYPLKPHLTALIESAASGCKCCGILLQYARDTVKDYSPQQDNTSPFSRTRKAHEGTDIETMPIWLCQKAIGYPEQLRKPIIRDGSEYFAVKLWFGQPDGNPRKMIGGVQAILRTFSYPPSSNLSTISAVTESNHTSEAYGIATQWIDNCTAYHESCRDRQDPTAKAPSRLLYVGTIEEPAMKLIETAGRTVSEMPYICLSHCWGPNLDQVAVTTKTTNLTERLHRVRAEELSRTFVEAIEIARNLQKLYIWIDALCICQDSLEDWRAVSANMASIYINAVFTLAASASKNSSEGLFRVRDPFITLRLVLAWHDLPDREILLAPPMITPCYDSGPLSTRGWCYQERKLPPRVLHFTDDELYWECECWQTQESQVFVESAFRNARGPPPPAEWRGDKMGRGPEHAYYHRWRETVEEYSRRYLTRDTDRLVAISGVLRAYFWRQILANAPQDVYLAGLFKGDFVDSMFWIKDNFFPGRMRHTSAYVAPSWSWASVIGAVRVEQFFQDNDPPELVAAGVTLAGEDALGEVTDGYARMRGYIRSARCSDHCIEDPTVRPHRFFIRIKDYFTTKSIIESQTYLAPRFAILDEEGRMRGQVYFDDAADEVNADRELICLKRKVERETEEEALRKETKDRGIDPNDVEGFEMPPPRNGAFVLVLRRVVERGKDTYRRVGVGAIDDPDWFDGIEKKEFTIV